MISQILSTDGESSNVDDVFSKMTPEQQQLVRRRLREKGLDARQLPISPRVDRSTAQLSFGQERLWFLNRVDPLSAKYNVHSAFRLAGSLDIDALQRTLNALVVRHEVLRSSIQMADGDAVQIIRAEVVVPLTLLDLRDLSAEERVTRRSAFVQDDHCRPFNLMTGGVLRAGLIIDNDPVTGDELADITLTMHHIVCDGWSAEILRNDFLVLYDSFINGTQPSLPELPIQYGDFADWQRENIDDTERERLLGFWLRLLADLPDQIEFPRVRRRATKQLEEGAIVSLAIPQSVRSPLRDLCVAEDATPAMVVFAAYANMLSRYTQQDDLVIGMSVANRSRIELEHLIGFFVNTLAIRLDIGGSPTFRELVRRVRQVVLDAHAHHELPFEMLVRELRPHRELSHNPLFRTFYDFQSPIGPHAAVSIEGIRHGVPVPVAPKFDLSLSVRECVDGYLAVFEYNLDFFEHATVDAMGRHLSALLLGGVTQPDLSIGRLSMLSKKERAETLAASTGTVEAFHDGAVTDLIQEQIELHPLRTALAAGSTELTYAQLGSATRAFAADLRSRGVGQDEIVAVLLPRSVDAVVALLAIWECGATYLPIDVAQPANRIRMMLGDSRSHLVVSDRDTAHRLLDPAVDVFLIDEDRRSATAGPIQPVAVPRTADADAAILFTSGSTGRPKGVRLTHRGLCNMVAAQRVLINVTPTDRVQQFASLGFDAATFEMLLALTSGAALCIAPEETKVPGPQLAEHMARERISIAFFPPSALRAVPRVDLPYLHTVCVGGEVCTTDLVAAWSPGRRFFNLYGPTEASIWTTAQRCFDNGVVPGIGDPIANVSAYLLDRNLDLVPNGAPGELVVGGNAVAAGYIGSKVLTAQRFVPDPFSQIPGAIMYRTGDRVRRGPDGFEFCGRLDDQVKLRGFRIEPGEVAAVLRRHYQIADAAAKVQRRFNGEDRLVAYFVPAEHGVEPAPGELRSYLLDQLPRYMVPAQFVSIHALPTLASGKIDFRSLPAPPQHDRASGSEYVAPRSEEERRMATLWAEVLEIERIGICDDFFDQGGHSLLVARLASRILEAFNVEVPLDELFRSRTVEAACALVGRLREDDETTAVQPIVSDLTNHPVIDEMSDGEVNRLLGQVLGSLKSSVVPGPAPASNDREFELLMIWLDGLSDEIIDLMLNSFFEESSQ